MNCPSAGTITLGAEVPGLARAAIELNAKISTLAVLILLLTFSLLFRLVI